MKAPNIHTSNSHRNCWQLDHSSPDAWKGFPGDVRRCRHGKIQVRTQLPPNAKVGGPGTDWFRDLSPIFHPIQYRRARKALS